MNNSYRIVDLKKSIFDNDTYIVDNSPYNIARDYAKSIGLNENSVKRVYDSNSPNVRLVIYGKGRSYLYAI